MTCDRIIDALKERYFCTDVPSAIAEKKKESQYLRLMRQKFVVFYLYYFSFIYSK